MKIADRTPFRNQSGQIDLLGRARGTLKYGLSWYSRLKAQETVIAVLDKALGAEYILLRNITLPNTEIDLPLVLIGPPGIYLITATHERGVYRARDDEWGTVSGDKFVPAGINLVQRTSKLGRVLQIYLDRAGFKGEFIVEPILMAADPGMHIESVRPVVRVVLSDALERFAISMNQARPIFNAIKIGDIAKTILTGPKKQASAVPASVQATSAGGGQDTTEVLFSQATGSSASPVSGSSPNLNQPAQTQSQSQPAAQNTLVQTPAFQTPLDDFGNLRETGSPFFEDNEPDGQTQSQEENTNEPPGFETQTETSDSSAPSTPVQKKAGRFGMTTAQLLFLGAILLFWLCSVVAFFVYLYFNL